MSDARLYLFIVALVALIVVVVIGLADPVDEPRWTPATHGTPITTEVP